MKQYLKRLILTVSLVLAWGATAEPAIQARDTAVEEANRQLVLTFYDRFFNRHDTVHAAKVVADDYRQHNPDVPNGKAPLVDYFTDFFKSNPQSRARLRFVFDELGRTGSSAAPNSACWLRTACVQSPKKGVVGGTLGTA
jgi:hypothetical protein